MTLTMRNRSSLWFRRPEEEVLPMLEELGIGFIPYRQPVGRGGRGLRSAHAVRAEAAARGPSNHASRVERSTTAGFLPIRDPTGSHLEDWRQLTITSAPVDIVAPTLVGNDLFDLDAQGQFRCSQDHVLGLNRLSELWVRREGYDGSDLVRTKQLTGARRGVLHPKPEILLSPKLYRLLRELKVGRLVVEVAHLT